MSSRQSSRSSSRSPTPRSPSPRRSSPRRGSSANRLTVSASRDTNYLSPYLLTTLDEIDWLLVTICLFFFYLVVTTPYSNAVNIGKSLNYNVQIGLQRIYLVFLLISGLIFYLKQLF